MKPKKFPQPQNDLVLVKTEPNEAKSKGGLWLPVADVQKRYGEVLNLPDPVPDYMHIAVGDMVFFAGGSRFIIDTDSKTGVETCMVPYYSILAKIEE
jgi:co-chaperonin GroES (HSP10)